MGLRIELQTEVGEALRALDDPINLLHETLHSSQADSLLAGIDWYADTTFNSQQMPRFLKEWGTLMQGDLTPAQRELLTQIQELGLECRNTVHLYLKFIGD